MSNRMHATNQLRNTLHPQLEKGMTRNGSDLSDDWLKRPSTKKKGDEHKPRTLSELEVQVIKEWYDKKLEETRSNNQRTSKESN